MASNTQGYEAAESGVIEKIIDRFKNRKKDDGESQNSAPDQPGSPTSPTSSMLIQGATVNQLMSASPGLAKPPINITEYGEDRVLQAILIEQQKTNQILTAQNQILTAPTGIGKFDKQEQDIEAIDDLSGTQGYEKAKSSWWRKLLTFLGLKFAKVLASLKTLVPAIVAAATKITNAVLLTGAASTLTNIFSKGLNKLFTKKFLPKVKPNIDVPKVTPKLNTPKVEVPSSVSTSKLDELYNAKRLQNLENLNVKPNSRVLNNLEVGSGKTTSLLTKVDETVDAGNSIKSTNKMLRGKNLVSNSAEVISDTSKLSKLSKIKGLKYVVPGLSSITSVLNLASGNYAEAIIDGGDAAADIAMVSGGVTAKAIGGAVSKFLAPIGAMMASSWLGEATRGWGDWITGDGTNGIRNALGGVVNALSASLEVIGAPLTGLIEFVKSGFNMEKSNKKMAELDSNIREGFRKSLNVIDFMNVIPDDVGGFGTLSWYGDDNVDAANKKLKEDKGIVDEGEVKNSRGGSYFLDNPTNMGPFQGGEAGGEVVTFTPFGGRRLVNEMGQHMTDALQSPFKFAIGGIAAAIDKVTGTLGPIGKFMKQAIGPTLGKLVKASGLTNLNLGGVSTGIGNLLTGAPANAGGIFGDLLTGAKSNAKQVAQMFTGQREDTDYSAVLPQGRPVLTSKFGPRNLGYGSTDHKGIDIGVDRGSPVTAMEDGTVTSIIPDFMHGSAVVVTSDAGDATLYGHVDPTVEKGQEVSRGETIAKVKYWPGTGNMAADNTHLHLERHPGGYDGLSSAVDPLEFTKNSSKTLNQSKNITSPKDNTSNNVGATKTVGSVFMPNISNTQLSPEALLLAQGQQQLMGAIQSMNKTRSKGDGGGNGSTSGLTGFTQPATDSATAAYTMLHLQRLGVS